MLILVNARCEANVRDTNKKDTPHHEAASNGQVFITRALLDRETAVGGYENILGRDALQEARAFR